MYQPKLYLRFNPPIYNDSIGNRQLDKILSLIENEYPETTWFEGQSPADYNPFTDEDEDIPDQIKSLTIGHWPDKTDVITYGMWDDNDMDYQNFIDGWEWYNKKGYVDTESIFNSLNEDNSENGEDYSPKVTYVFDPPIEDKETLRNVLYVIGLEHLGIMWPTNKPILNDSIYREIFDNNEGYDFVGGLTIHPGKVASKLASRDSDIITWTSWVEPLGSYSDYGPKVDGWQLVNKHSIPNTEDVFNNLNESKRQPKLNLRFNEPISEADELDKVLKVLAIVYPGLKWTGDNPVGTYNVIRDTIEDDFRYDPIYYLTIGFFSHAPDKLTYTSGPADDSSFADDEHGMFNWVDGWDWVRNNEIDYDETTDMFNQLNESYDFLKTTNLIGYIFKATAENDPRYWVTRQVINDNGDNLIVNMGYSEAWEDDIGIEDFPKQKSIKKDMVIDFIDSGKWEIIGLPNDNNFDTFDIFDKLNESIDYNSHPLLNHFVIFDETNTKEDIKYVIDTLINFGLDGERGKKNVWTSQDTDILYEDYIETKMEGDDRLVIGSKNAKNSDDMFIHYGRKGEYAGHDVVFISPQEFFTMTNFNTEDVFNELI